jgi:hypothetical protein
MPLIMVLLAALLPIGAAGCGSNVADETVPKEIAMTQPREAVLKGDGPPARISVEEVRRMGAALREGLARPELAANSGAPETLLAQARQAFGEPEITEAGQVRAGEWLLVSAVQGPRWDLRLAAPEPPRIGLLFRVPLERTNDDWRASAVQFVRVR